MLRNERQPQLPEKRRLLDGTIIANSLADLTDGSISHAINRDETGSLVNGALVWTGTMGSGLGAAEHCDDWSTLDGNGVVGSTDATDGEWTSTSTHPCDGAYRLYCFSSTTVPVESARVSCRR